MKLISNQLSLALTALALGIATSFPQSVSAATLYSVLDLGTVFEGDIVFATGLNDLGQVVGESFSAFNVVTFRTAPNSPINPATDSITVDFITLSNDINNSGQVVATGIGASRLSSGVRTDINGLLTDSLFPVVEMNAINDLGQIAGRALVAGCNFGCSQREVINAVRVENSNTVIDLGSLGGEGSRGNGINDLGQVVGSSTTTDNQTRAFRTAPNSVINSATDDLETLGGSSSGAIDVNNLGQVVGNSTTTDGETHAFRTAANSDINAETDDLGTLGGDFSTANAINELGQVVGSSELADGDIRAFLFDENTMFDLNDLIADGGNFVFTEAISINEQGQIAVNGYFGGSDPQTSSRAFLLTPVPEPTTMLGVLAFSAGAGFLRKRSKQKVKV